MGSQAPSGIVHAGEGSLKGKFMKITDDRVVARAKYVLLPRAIECETLKSAPNDKFTVTKCEAKLNCWEAFQKHQIQHARDACKNTDKRYTCPFRKCNRKLHRSLELLAAHIEDTHLKGLPCPFATCPTHSTQTDNTTSTAQAVFTRHSLITHVHEQHAELVGSRVERALLLPTAKPHRMAHIHLPPPLLSSCNDDIRLGGLFVPPVSIPKTEHFTHLIASFAGGPNASGPSSLPAAHKQNTTKLPHKTMTLRKHPQRALPPQSDQGQSDSQYEFANFPTIEFFRDSLTVLPASFTPLDILSPPNFVVQPTPPERGLDLMRGPRPGLGRKEKAPPGPSIFYPVLQKEAFAGYARGEGAVTDMMRE
ncbi:hypothetical protein FB45DRAFT_891401 [Roridomyces roridus]|uniref:C2H2-type domain-containing protein n=1 Tax=Roridomyces roridus TaxID=1738132 RepID=A0AAD7FW38_9AGAR|nr:hypothetical protein FB45DRAFT_891401 [Roridomyces roridus]